MADRIMRRPCKEDWSIRPADAGVGSCWRPEVCVGRTDAGSEGTDIRQSCFPSATPLPAAFCRLIFYARFLPAGFVSNSFRHIVSDTNYKERGIFYG